MQTTYGGSDDAVINWFRVQIGTQTTGTRY